MPGWYSGALLIFLDESKPGDPGGTQMQIPAHLGQSGVFEDQHRFEPALEHVTPATMSPVEPTGIAGLKPADGVAEVGFPAAQLRGNGV